MLAPSLPRVSRLDSQPRRPRTSKHLGSTVKYGCCAVLARQRYFPRNPLRGGEVRRSLWSTYASRGWFPLLSTHGSCRRKYDILLSKWMLRLLGLRERRTPEKKWWSCHEPTHDQLEPSAQGKLRPLFPCPVRGTQGVSIRSPENVEGQCPAS